MAGLMARTEWNMIYLGNCIFLQCCCGCGMITAKLKVDPGAFRPKYFGFITGHESRPNVAFRIIGPDYLQKARMVEYLLRQEKATRSLIAVIGKKVSERRRA